MDLKELRISKGLNQNECAKYLNISLRSYQNYENDISKIDTIKYKVLINKLKDYSNNTISYLHDSKVDFLTFNTNVITGKGIGLLYDKVKRFNKRECYSLLKKYIDGSFDGKICVLYGLRRTGKTTLLFQMLGELPVDKTCYIKIKTTDNMNDLIKDLKILYNAGYKYIFIDEITLLDDFINTAATLSDIFSMLGMKIVVTGTDSLGFAMANNDELYDRNIMIHTSFISFKEYVNLLNINSIDKYIEYGGTLKMENMSFDDPDFLLDEVSFKDDESTRKYIDSAITRNIQHSLKNNNFGKYFDQLKELYDNNELTNVINRIIENINHNFLLSVVEQKFKSHDFGSTKNLLLHQPFSSSAFILDEVNYQQIITRLKEIIEIKEKEELNIKVNNDHIEKLKKYLIILDLIVNSPIRHESYNESDYYIFTQPGMRYSITKALVYSLMKDEYFISVSEKDKDIVIEKMLLDVKGKMLEDIVLLEVTKSLKNKDIEVFKFKFDLGGEFDMVIFNKKDYTCSLYEIKHSDKINNNQTKYLLDDSKCQLIEKKYGKITSKYVLYRGEDKQVNDIKYLNVEKFLLSL